MEGKIFVIEDDINILSALEAKLAHEGFRVETDAGADEIENVLSRIEIFKPDYIIMDLILPRMDGAKLLCSIRTQEEEAKIPVFIFTDMSDEDVRAMGGKLGANCYFVKTDLNVDEFVGKIKKIIFNLTQSQPTR
jgi:two-component system, OmpR family, alkaline phosphatase synthesis response regulator PhoP